MSITPVSACISISYAFWFLYGPSSPKPEIEQVIRRGYSVLNFFKSKPRRSKAPGAKF